MSIVSRRQPLSGGASTGGIDHFMRMYCFIIQWITAQMWWLHGPPSKEVQTRPRASNAARFVPLKTPLRIFSAFPPGDCSLRLVRR